MSASTVEAPLELEQYGLTEVSLMDGERLELSLDLGNGSEESSDSSTDLLLLTNQRVVHVEGNRKSRKAVFASIGDISMVEVAQERPGYSTYIWAGLAFLVAIMLWQTIDNAFGSIAAPIVVALMGAYLIADHVMTPGRPVAVFKAGSSEFRCNLTREGTVTEAYELINRLFQLKGSSVARGSPPARRFAPR